MPKPRGAPPDSMGPPPRAAACGSPWRGAAPEPAPASGERVHAFYSGTPRWWFSPWCSFKKANPKKGTNSKKGTPKASTPKPHSPKAVNHCIAYTKGFLHVSTLVSLRSGLGETVLDTSINNSNQPESCAAPSQDMGKNGFDAGLLFLNDVDQTSWNPFGLVF